MHQLNDLLSRLDGYIGGSQWFVFILLGTGLFFTIYLGFPQVRYFRHALKIVSGKFDKKGDVGDTSHFQALTTALSGTVGTGNIAGVALAIHLGGPAALFWMLVTAFFGMTTKFVEVTLSHKYRETADDGTIAGGPMYYMKNRLNFTRKNGKKIKVGIILGGVFAVCTILSSFGTGNLPQINSISNSIFATFGIKHMVTGGILAVLLAFVIIGGIKRIAKVTSKLVPAMALIYFIGALGVLFYNYENILPAISSVFSDVFTGSAALGGFIGASVRFAFNRGVNRGLFSNEAGQGSAPIAHAAARAHEPVSEGMVAILEPFVDTIIICFLTGITLLASGAWKEKYENTFQLTDMEIVEGVYMDQNTEDRAKLFDHIKGKQALALFTGDLNIEQGEIKGEVTILQDRSVAEDVKIYHDKDKLYSGLLPIVNGKPTDPSGTYTFIGKSLLSSAPLTTQAFTMGLFGSWGQYIVSIGLLLFAFSTAISWSYYGDRAVTYLWGTKYVMVYRIIYVAGFFVASFTDTTIIWTFSGIAIALMALPNLLGLLVLHREVKSTINQYWIDFKSEFPTERGS
ncbi:MAG: sodium:alanine symporter family protein [Bacteroidales bacterium]|nr:sodium:alanine symporter family protein [Bacteroidales bacterium]